MSLAIGAKAPLIWGYSRISNLALPRIMTDSALLNGTTLDGKKADYAPGFKETRYAVVLLAVIAIPVFRRFTEQVQKSTYANPYKLKQVAGVLLLDFDRTNTEIYEELQKSKHVTKLVTQDNKTFIKLTRSGEDKCMEDLESLLILVEYFHSHPELQNKHVRNGGQSYVSKGPKSRTSLIPDLDN
jgi:hypothetical protein